MMRKIIHVDMDAFFAAVEVRDNPQYKGKPLIVGGDPNSRGVVSTCSYEARRYGIHSAMPSSHAYRLCPHAIFVRGRFEAYREASEIVKSIFYEYTDLVEPVSIDEAYLDVTENIHGIDSATEIARQIRQKIFERTQLTASAGVSYNKFLAKIGSDLDKPDGLVVIPPNKAAEVLDKLPIGKFHGIGKKSEEKMKKLGITNGFELRKWSLKDLLKHFGKVGSFYYYIVRGIDEREVKTNRIRKSIGMERTFSIDINDNEEMIEYLKKFAAKLSGKMREKRVKAKTLTLKIKYSNFDLVTKCRSLSDAFDDEKIIAHLAQRMLVETIAANNKIRLLGLSLSHLEWEDDTDGRQMILPFYDEFPRFVG